MWTTVAKRLPHLFSSLQFSWYIKPRLYLTMLLMLNLLFASLVPLAPFPTLMCVSPRLSAVTIQLVSLIIQLGKDVSSFGKHSPAVYLGDGYF
jgi:hypothetical protein